MEKYQKINNKQIKSDKVDFFKTFYVPKKTLKYLSVIIFLF